MKLSMHASSPLLLLLSSIFFACNVSSISTNIHLPTDVAPEQGFYTAFLYLGTPVKSVKFQVSFRANDVLLFYDATGQSISYSSESASELFYFGSKAYRLAARIGTSHEKTQFLSCSDCKGILGLGPDSVFWDIWPSISFSYGGIHLGDDRDSFLMDLDEHDTRRFCELEKLGCRHDDVGLCTTTAVYENETFPLRFMGDHAFIKVPQRIYRHYFDGKNVYKDKLANWQLLTFRIPAENFHSMHAMCEHEDHFKQDGGYLLEFDYQELVFIQNDGTTRIMVRPNDNENDTTIELGIQLWRRFAIRKTTAFSNAGHVLLKRNIVHQHADTLNLTLVVILAISWIRWNLTGMPGNFVLDVENTIYYVLEFAAMVIAIVSLFLNSTLDVLLPDYTAFYVISVAIVALSIGIEIAAMVAFYRLPALEKQTLAQHHTLFLSILCRNVAHQILTAVAVNLLLVEQRSESIATILTVFTSLISVYIIFYYFFGISVYFMYMFFDRKNLPEIDLDQKLTSVAVMLYIATMLVFTVIATQLFFLKPFLERAAAIYIDLVPMGVFIVYIAVVLASIVLYALHHRQTVIADLIQRHKKLREARENEKSQLPTPLENLFLLNSKANVSDKVHSRHPAVHQQQQDTTILEHHLTDYFIGTLDIASS